MNKTTFSERLNITLDKEGFPPKHKGRIQLLAEMMGLTHRGASKWVNGESRPPEKKLRLLAEKLNINPSWLMTGQGPSSIQSPKKISRPNILLNIPIYHLHDLPNKKNIIDTFQTHLSYTSDFFAIKLETEAMSPRFPQGTLAIFDPVEAQDGDFIIANHSDFPSPIFRQLLIFNKIYYLNAYNPKFDRLILLEKNKIFGKLIQAIISF